MTAHIVSEQGMGVAGATMRKVVIPEMDQYGYDQRLPFGDNCSGVISA